MNIDSLKDSFLEKNNCSSTEEFLSTIKAPDHSCQYIDEFIQDFFSAINYLESIQNKLKEIPTGSIQNPKEYQYYVNIIDEILEEIILKKEEIDQSISLLNSFRENCLSRREAVKSIKVDFWNAFFNKEYKKLFLNKDPYFYEGWVFEFSLNFPKINSFEESNFIEHFPTLKNISIDFSKIKNLYIDLFKWGNEICENGNKELIKFKE